MCRVAGDIAQEERHDGTLVNLVAYRQTGGRRGHGYEYRTIGVRVVAAPTVKRGERPSGRRKQPSRNFLGLLILKETKTENANQRYTYSTNTFTCTGFAGGKHNDI